MAACEGGIVARNYINRILYIKRSLALHNNMYMCHFLFIVISLYNFSMHENVYHHAAASVQSGGSSKYA